MNYRLSIFLPLCVVACAHKSDTPPPSAAPPPQAAAPAPAANPPATLAAMACSIDDQCHSDQICISNACTAVTAALDACGTQRVHFPFNSAMLPDTEKPTLSRAARCLTASRGLRLRIEGNADERGTEEYNLALGEQRARAVGKYLHSLGASDAQIKTVSYGKDQPLCTEHDEACWAQNRRAALQVTAADP